MGTRNRSNRNAENRTDEAAGSEGIEDPAMEAGRQQGRELMDDATDFGGQGGQREGSPEPEGTGYTADSRNLRENSRERSERNANNVDDGSREDRNMTEDSENPVE
jgi:hypothetical protein